MIIKLIKLNNFRCHKEYSLKCEESTTLILGENGCGKTSVLEGVYEALQGKSFRAVDKEIVRRGAEYYRVELGLDDGRKISVVYDGVEKKFLLDKKYKRLPRNMKYPVILFEPADLNLVASSPGRRRDYFDRFLGQLDERYANSLARYTKALKQRNEALKGEIMDGSALFAWDVMLAQYGCKIAEWRKKMIQRMNEELTNKYHSIADNEDKVEIIYRTEVGEDDSKYMSGLMGVFEKDKILGHTNYGVHRDSYDFVFNGEMADGSASRGEVRSMILAMKFLEAEMLEKTLEKKPIILLDDVFSELDEGRQKALKNNFRDHQIIITSVR